MRRPALDRFRLAAAVLVAAIHTSPLTTYTALGDFYLTRVLGRVAVPFFLMATGQFTLLPLLQPGGARRLPRFLRKTGLLYGACMWLFGMNRYERGLVTTIVRKFLPARRGRRRR